MVYKFFSRPDSMARQITEYHRLTDCAWCVVGNGRWGASCSAINIWARGLLKSSGFAFGLRASRVQRLNGLGSSVTGREPNEPRGLLKSFGFAVGLKVLFCEVVS